MVAPLDLTCCSALPRRPPPASSDPIHFKTRPNHRYTIDAHPTCIVWSRPFNSILSSLHGPQLELHHSSKVSTIIWNLECDSSHVRRSQKHICKLLDLAIVNIAVHRRILSDPFPINAKIIWGTLLSIPIGKPTIPQSCQSAITNPLRSRSKRQHPLVWN